LHRVGGLHQHAALVVTSDEHAQASPCDEHPLSDKNEIGRPVIAHSGADDYA
jgi:hypothetical protein